MFQRPTPTRRLPHEDPVNWAIEETVKFAVWKCKVWGTATFLLIVLLSLFLAGMPAHRFWNWSDSDLDRNSHFVCSPSSSFRNACWRVAGKAIEETKLMSARIIRLRIAAPGTFSTSLHLTRTS